ncbi:uncharacterized protein LOC119159594 isoform X2 [Rhipicephalus microplus]|uniref:uncharacterized protein LOC119159594 isoform X2 n=1 Tax=Rhipicephalus microplus TaxID=6941 RepID=UPI003F6BA090
MFRSKNEVDRHVAGILARCRDEHQKKVQGFKFAKHYVNVKDYESARKYLGAYLAVHGDYAAAHKLMGQIQEALESPYEAIRSYKCCLDLDESQKDVLLKICKIYADLPADRQAIKYWLKQAEDHFPGHSIVVKLKEMLTRAQGVPDVKDKEDLIRSEIMESPLDVEYRVKLLELLLDTGRVRDAFTHALQAEEDPQFNAEATYSLLWQRCVTNVTKAYHHDQTENELRVDELFLTTYLLRLDQLAILTLHNPNGSSLCALSGSGGTDPNKLGAKSTLEDAVSAVESLDILLNEAHKQLFLSSAWNFVLQHVTAQLYLHVATLVLKMPVKVSYDWQEAQCWAASLLERAYSAHPPCALSQEDWFLELDSEKRNLYHNVFLQAHHRLSVSGHILHVLCNAEDKSSWLADVKKEACSFEVRKRIYTGIFNGKGSTSWFLQDTSFVNSAAEFPSLVALHKHDQESQRLHAASLDHLAWLKLQWSSLQDKKCGETGQPFEVQVFEALPLEPPSFRSGAVETLSQVDMLAFLEATCYCASEALKRKAFRPGQGPLALPPHVGMQLCTGPQAHWWRAAYHTNARHALSKKVDLRCIMQRGLEVVRAIGNHGMDLILVVHLARTFSKKSSLSCADGLEEEAKAFENQAKHYWEAVLSKIESRSIPLNPVMPSGRLFCVPGSYAVNSMQELKQIQQEARMFLALNAMNAGCLDEAAKMFSGLTSARAAYYTALRKEQVALKLALERSCHESDWTLATRVSALLDDLQERMRHTSFTSGCSDDSDDELSSGGQNGFPPHLPYPKISSARWPRSSTPKPDKSFYPRCTPPREFLAPEATPEAPPPKQNADATADAPAFASQILELRLKSLLLHQELAMSQLQQMQEASQSMIKDQLDSHRHVLAEVKQQKTAVERIMKNVDEVAARTMLTADAASPLQHQNEGSEQSIGRGSDRGYSRRKALASDRARLQSARGPRRASTPPSTPHMQSPAYGNYPMSYLGYPIAFLPWAQPLRFHFLLQPFVPSHGTTAITNVPVQSFYSMPRQVAHHVSHPPPSTSFASCAPSDSATGNVGQTLAFRHSAEPQTPAPAPGLASAFALATVLPPMQDYKESSMPAVSMHLDGAAVPAATLHTSQTYEFYVPANTTSAMSRRGGGKLVTSIGPRRDTKGTSTVDSSSSSIATTVMTNELATSVGPRTDDTKGTSAVDLPLPSSAATAMATDVVTSIEPRTDTKETSTVNLPLPSRVATAKAMQLATSVEPRTDTKKTSTVDLPLLFGAATATATNVATSIEPRTDTEETSTVDLPLLFRAATATATDVATSIEPRTDTKETSTVDLPLLFRAATAKTMELATSVEPRTNSKETSTVDLPLLFRAATAKTMELATSVEPRTNSKETSTVDSPLSSRSASTDMAVS